MHRAVRSLLAQKTNCMGRPVFFSFFFHLTLETRDSNAKAAEMCESDGDMEVEVVGMRGCGSYMCSSLIRRAWVFQHQ